VGASIDVVVPSVERSKVVCCGVIAKLDIFASAGEAVDPGIRPLSDARRYSYPSMYMLALGIDMARPVPTPFQSPLHPAGSAMITLISCTKPPSVPAPTSFLPISFAPSLACSPNAAIPFPADVERRNLSASSWVTISPHMPAHLDGCRQPSGAGGIRVAPDPDIVDNRNPDRPDAVAKEGTKEDPLDVEGEIWALKQVALAVLRGEKEVGVILCLRELGPGPA
jgi:hypothetical protein